MMIYFVQFQIFEIKLNYEKWLRWGLGRGFAQSQVPYNEILKYMYFD